MDEELELIIKIEKEFQAIIKKYFPQMRLSNWGSSGPVFDANYSTINSAFIDSEYFYNDPLEFFHLTSVQTLFSILNSKSIRLYNLHNSNDTEEYKYSANLFNASELEINAIKNNIYTFSFCPLSELKNNILWEKYGKLYSGVALVFKIENDITAWDNFNIAQIKYSLSDAMKNYSSEMENLRIKYSGCSFNLNLHRFMAFHKQQEWEAEKEVRILTYYPYKYHYERLKYIKPELKLENGRNRFSEYYELNLFVDNESPYLNQLNIPLEFDRKQSLHPKYFIKSPKIVITDIIFGYRCGISSLEFQTFKNRIEEIIQFNFGYKVNLSQNFISPH